MEQSTTQRRIKDKSNCLRQQNMHCTKHILISQEVYVVVRTNTTQLD